MPTYSWTEVIEAGEILTHDNSQGLAVTWNKENKKFGVWSFDMTGHFQLMREHRAKEQINKNQARSAAKNFLRHGIWQSGKVTSK